MADKGPRHRGYYIRRMGVVAMKLGVQDFGSSRAQNEDTQLHPSGRNEEATQRVVGDGMPRTYEAYCCLGDTPDAPHRWYPDSQNGAARLVLARDER